MKTYFLKAEDAKRQFITAPFTKDVYDTPDANDNYFGHSLAARGVFVMMPDDSHEAMGLCAPFGVSVHFNEGFTPSFDMAGQHIGTMLTQNRASAYVYVLGDPNAKDHKHASPMLVFDRNVVNGITQEANGIVTFRGCGHIELLTAYRAGTGAANVPLIAGELHFGVIVMFNGEYDTMMVRADSLDNTLAELLSLTNVERIAIVGAFAYASKDDVWGFHYMSLHESFLNVALAAGKSEREAETFWEVGEALHKNNTRKNERTRYALIHGHEAPPAPISELIGELGPLLSALGVRGPQHDVGSMIAEAIGSGHAKIVPIEELFTEYEKEQAAKNAKPDVTH